MPHLHRFFVPESTPHEGSVCLDGEEAHHALRAVRVRPGDTVGLLDGAGTTWTAQVTEAAKREVMLAIESVAQQPKPAPELTLACATITRDKGAESIIRDGTVLGVGRFIFFRAARSERPARHAEKWARWAREACKQCGRAWLPQFATADSLAEALGLCTGSQAIRLGGEAGAQRMEAALPQHDAALFIGPEGDFDPAECAQLAHAGAACVSLGAMVLRTELAAVTAATLAAQAWGRLGPPDA